ncbi:MAG: hypothetical protein ACLS61_11195 [Ruminococcus sp.]
MLAGISGGIYIKNGGNLLKLLGNSILGITGYESDTGTNNSEKCKTPTTIIKNCYTYVENARVAAIRIRLLLLNLSAVMAKPT